MSNTKAPDKSIKDTGERMVPAYHKGHMVYGEHIVRYSALEELVSGKTVLDIASGSGYGTAALSKKAKKVYGVDVNKSAISYAKKNYQTSNNEFLLGDGVSIPLETGSVDVVVSLETIEHIEDYKKFMQEVKRVLRKDGIFILSTPNDIEFSEGNHFHLHEFTEKELEKLVGEYFDYHESYYQATWLYNALVTRDLLSREWVRPVLTMQTSPIDTEKCLYFYLICTNNKDQLPPELNPIAAISEHYSARSQQEYEVSVRKHIEDQGAVIRHLDDEIKKLQNKNSSLENNLKEASEKLEAIYSHPAYKAASKAKHLLKHGKKS